MARTALRSRSGGTVTTVQLADRTGIVAASLPRQREDDQATAPLPVATVAEPVSVPPRPARRYWILAAAAILFMMVGWAGGGMFGVPYGPDPSVETFSASGNAYQEVPPAQPPVVAAPTPPVALPPPPPVAPTVKPVRTKQKQAADTESTPSRKSTRSQASEPDFRDDVVAASPAPKPAELARDQLVKALQPMLDAMRHSSLSRDGH